MRGSKKEIKHSLAGLEYVKPVRGENNGYYYGGIYRHIASGRMVYVAERAYGDIFREGMRTMSEAIRNDVARVAFDEKTCIGFRASGIAAIIVRVTAKSAGKVNFTQFYAIQREKVTTPSHKGYWTRHDYTGVGAKGGENQRYVFFKYFWRTEKLGVNLS